MRPTRKSHETVASIGVTPHGEAFSQREINQPGPGVRDVPAGPTPFPGKISLAAKVAATTFLAIMVPIYWHTYGLTNFLWFCDAALVLTVAGMWLESPLIISMCATGILVPQCLWLVDFGGHLLGMRLLGMTSYMSDSRISLFTRGLSLFHGWLPLLLLWLVFRLGYDKRALAAWTAVAAALALGSYFFALPAGAHPANPDLPINVNYIYGFNDQQPQHWINQSMYVILWLGVLWLVAFLPAHLVLRKVFAPYPPAVHPKRTIRFF